MKRMHGDVIIIQNILRLFLFLIKLKNNKVIKIILIYV
jgi:hypothetical protein